MMSLRYLGLCLIGISTLACSGAKPKFVAKSINSMVTAITLGSGEQTLNAAQFNCGSDTYELDGSLTVSSVGSRPGYYLVSLDGSVKGTEFAKYTPVNCIVTLRYSTNSGGTHLTGGGTLDSCDDLSNCSVDGTGIECEELKSAFSDNTCS